MQFLPYSQLDGPQREHIAYLFADDIFGTDAAAFQYELTETGEVKGRTRIEPLPVAASKRKPRSVKVIAREEVSVTDEMIQHARTNMDALAAIVARDLYERSTMEIQQEVSS